MAKKTKTKSKLEIATDILGKSIKPIFTGFNDTNFKLENYRNDFISYAYDYLKVLRTEDSNEDNHSFNAINKTIFNLVNLDETKNHHTYFRKFSNTCVKGALLLHWQDLKKCDENDIELSGLTFAKDKSVNWLDIKGRINKDKTQYRIQYSIRKGMLLAPYNFLVPTIIVKNKKEINEDATMIIVDAEKIKNLYARYKDTTARDIEDNQAIEINPTMDGIITALNVASDMLKDLTRDRNLVASCFVHDKFNNAWQELKEQQNNVEIVRNKNNVDDAPTPAELKKMGVVNPAELVKLKSKLENK